MVIIVLIARNISRPITRENCYTESIADVFVLYISLGLL